MEQCNHIIGASHDRLVVHEDELGFYLIDHHFKYCPECGEKIIKRSPDCCGCAFPYSLCGPCYRFNHEL